MKRALLAVVLALVALAFVAAPAGAGGWAVTTLDPLPTDGFVAGTPTDIGYTMRQHGVTPVNEDGTAIIVRAEGAAPVRFAGRQVGPVGHYVATVSFPSAGRYEWSVDQGWFEDQVLGVVDVGTDDGAVAVSTTSGTTSGWPWPVQVLLVVATAGALVLLGIQVAAWRGRPHKPASSGA